MDSREKIATSLVLAAILLLTGTDVIADWMANTPLDHLLIEIFAGTAAATGLVVLWIRTLSPLRRALSRSESELATARGEATRWRVEAAQYLEGLGQAIDRQFDRWGLTASEKEVALLLLKGLSLREIAEVRQVSERTARHQSLAVYRKAGLTGRADLAAFFLEDLMAPNPGASDNSVDPGGPA